MALKLKTIPGGWQIIYMESAAGAKTLWDVTGSGDTFQVPDDILEIRKRSFSRVNCPKLKKVFIPRTVQLIRQDAFDGFDPTLEIFCEKEQKPDGYFDGEYIEEFMEDGVPYYITHYGCWLHRSVVVQSKDCDGRLTWISPSAEQEIQVRPTTYWGCEMPKE